MAHSVDRDLRPLTEVARLPQTLAGFARDLLALTKPQITAMALIVAAGTMFLAPGHIAFKDALWSLLGIGMAVAGAGALNMLVERDVDALMIRTARRPLPTGRLGAGWALVVGGGLAGASLPILLKHATPLCAALTAFSLFVYVLVYTPMKRTSPWALVVGAVPGAMPALMGASAVSGRFDIAGVALFFWVFLWQIPHFTAIAVYREREYAAAGHRVVSSVWGARAAVVLIVASAALLAAAGVALVPLGVGARVTLVAAIGLGAWFALLAARGLFAQPRDVDAWARRVFRASLVYQTALFGALAVDALLAHL